MKYQSTIRYILFVAISCTTPVFSYAAETSSETSSEVVNSQTCEISSEALQAIEEAKNIENPGRQTTRAIQKAEEAIQYPACDSEKAIQFANDAIRQGSAMGNTSASAGSNTGVTCLEMADDTLHAGDTWNSHSDAGIFAVTTTATASISTTFCLPTASTEASRRDDETAFRDYQERRFVEKERDNLARDIANAEGEYMISMAYLQGCPADTHVHYAKVAQRNFARIFPNSEINAATIISNLRLQIARDPLLAKSCKRVS